VHAKNAASQELEQLGGINFQIARRRDIGAEGRPGRIRGAFFGRARSCAIALGVPGGAMSAVKELEVAAGKPASSMVGRQDQADRPRRAGLRYARPCTCRQ
jgi:hypothetical protein